MLQASRCNNLDVPELLAQTLEMNTQTAGKAAGKAAEIAKVYCHAQRNPTTKNP
jgi:hypothetical protein